MLHTRVLRIDPEKPDPKIVKEAGEALRKGALVAFPTETVYGLGANAFDARAVRRIFEAKERPTADPLIVHLVALEQMAPLVREMPAVLTRLEAFWPGPLTVVVPKSPLVPPEVTAGLDSVAIRFPAHPVARALIQAAGVPIAAPSANRFTRPSPTLAEHVLEDLEGRFELLLDGGPTWHGVESTVIDLTGPFPVLLRPGAVTCEQLLSVLPDLEVPSPVLNGEDKGGLKSPGTQVKHYSPRAKVLLYVGGVPGQVLAAMLARVKALLEEGRRVGVLLGEPWLEAFATLPVVRASLGAGGTPAAAAKRLYAALRELDRAGVDVIVTAGYSDRDLGRTLQDRLLRAAEGKVVRL